MSTMTIKAFIYTNTWTFAKSMPKTPHEYIVRNQTKNDVMFDRFVMGIRENGYQETHSGRTYTYFNIDGYKYWSMGNPVNETTIINRAVLPSYYDCIASKYDSLFDNDADRDVEAELLKHLTPFVAGTILDLGCGTGFLPVNINIHPSGYTGVDPSEKMLEVLKQRCPEHKDRLVNEKAESFQKKTVDLFNTVVSLFGSASYFDRPFLQNISKMLSPDDGVYFLMFYKEEYTPKTYERTGGGAKHNKHTESELAAIFENIYSFDNYYIATNVELEL